MRMITSYFQRLFWLGFKFVDQNKLAGIGSQLNGVVGPPITSTSTIAPLYGFQHVTGTAAIATITPPYPDFQGDICFIPDGAFTTVTTGNIAVASTAVVSKALYMTYDGSKWYPSY
jgi:hypothetical protein